MKAYWYDNIEVRMTSYASARHRSLLTLNQGDQRLPHDSGREVSVAQLEKVGVTYQHLSDIADVDALASSRQYKNRDQITVSPSAMGDIYETKVKSFFDEHMHEDEEIRYIRDGAGYFDVRSEGDGWIRIRLEKDDLIILPAGIYHRFTTDESNVSRVDLREACNQ
jgi:1,2-dihydroxy-3-keto-5-methylthiopentene dioxygenase